MTSPKGKTRRPAIKAAPSPVAVLSPSLEVLGALDIHDTFTALEARLDSIEIDIARQAGSREDDARRMAGDFAVMKARVEDALNAFSHTADEVRALAKELDKRMNATAARGEVSAMRAEVEARIDGATAGVGDVLESLAHDVRARIDGLGNQMAVVGESVARLSSMLEAFADLPGRMAALEGAADRSGRA